MQTIQLRDSVPVLDIHMESTTLGEVCLELSADGATFALDFPPAEEYVFVRVHSSAALDPLSLLFGRQANGFRLLHPKLESLGEPLLSAETDGHWLVRGTAEISEGAATVEIKMWPLSLLTKIASPAAQQELLNHFGASGTIRALAQVDASTPVLIKRFGRPMLLETSVGVKAILRDENTSLSALLQEQNGRGLPATTVAAAIGCGIEARAVEGAYTDAAFVHTMQYKTLMLEPFKWTLARYVAASAAANPRLILKDLKAALAPATLLKDLSALSSLPFSVADGRAILGIGTEDHLRLFGAAKVRASSTLLECLDNADDAKKLAPQLLPRMWWFDPQRAVRQATQSQEEQVRLSVKLKQLAGNYYMAGQVAQGLLYWTPNVLLAVAALLFASDTLR
jgi:hypothetical protein